MSLKLEPNEESFSITPIGIRYKCEFCHEGEMIADPTEPIVLPMGDNNMFMRRHICNNCKKEMRLPKTYPYIEWVPTAEIQAQKDFERLMKAPRIVNGEILYNSDKEGDNNSYDKPD